MRAALRAEAPVHHAAAVGGQGGVTQLALYRERRAGETHIDGAAAGTDVLAHAAPAGARHDRLGADRIADRAAQAASGEVHGWAPLKDVERSAEDITEGGGSAPG